MDWLEPIFAGAVVSALTFLLASGIQRRTRGSIQPRRIDGEIFYFSLGVVAILWGLAGVVRGSVVIGAVLVAAGAAFAAYGLQAGALRAR
jgi:hypothetical protein